MSGLGSPDRMISGRYRLITPDEQLPYRDVEVWQAADTLLGTKVRMILLPRDLPNRAAALDAARDVALLDGMHTVRVLSVSDDTLDSADPSYICTELLPGISLSRLVPGPLPADQVHAITGEVASIVAKARDHGVRHLALSPDRVRMDIAGVIFVDGLGIAAPLQGISTDEVFGVEADRMDVRGLAALAARLLVGPSEESDASVIAAALEADDLPAPLREVLTSDTAELPTVETPAACVRALEPWPEIRTDVFPGLPGATTISDDDAVETPNIDPELGIPSAPPVELSPQWVPVSAFTADDAADSDSDSDSDSEEANHIAEVPAAVMPVATAPIAPTHPKEPPVTTPQTQPQPSAQPRPAARPQPGAAPRPLAAGPSTQARPSAQPGPRRYNPSIVILAVTLVMVLVGAVWAVKTLFSPVELATDTQTTPATQGTGAPTGGEVPATEAPVDPTAGLPAPVITGVTLLNPHADLLVTNETTEQDSPSLVFRAWDGDPATSWKSWWYSRSNFSGKGGIGLAISLAETSRVTELELAMNSNGGNVQWRIDASADQPETGTVLLEGPMSGQTILTPSAPIATDTIILWFNDLPIDAEGKFRIDLAEIYVR